MLIRVSLPVTDPRVGSLYELVDPAVLVERFHGADIVQRGVDLALANVGRGVVLDLGVGILLIEARA